MRMVEGLECLGSRWVDGYMRICGVSGKRFWAGLPRLTVHTLKLEVFLT